MTLSAGSSLAHYRIVSHLGSGGMGEVYRAQDTKLERTVALKILRAELAADPDRMRRFAQEAKAASAINHPNVATIYEIGEAGGTHFIAMEYVEGEPLSKRVGGRPLESFEILDLAVQAVDALDEAHAKGVTHRDIKPANIMVTPRGQVKVLDFGLAKIVRPSEPSADAATEAMTQPGLVMGTVRYMSPEQALGRTDIDHRTDLFSLGVVLYEMTTGRLPFSGATATETLDRILHGQPEAISRFNYAAPAEIERMIRKCLEKDRERRYQSARELLVDLRNLKRDSDSMVAAAPAGAAGRSRRVLVAAAVAGLLAVLGGYLGWRWLQASRPIDSLAVLPFVNAGGNPDTEYLSDGITDSLINGLSQLPNLKLTARSLVFRHKGKDADPQKVGQDLKVRAVLTGRVVQRGDTLSIQAELMDVEEGSQLWGHQYNRKLADLLAVQEEIAREISDKLRLRLSGDQRKRLTKRYTENAEAHQAYLKGRYYIYKMGEEPMRKAIEFLNEAIRLEPNHAPAYAALAEAYTIAAILYMPPAEAFPRAKAAANKALALDDNLAEAHSALGTALQSFDWDWEAAERELRRAIELNPNYAWAHDWLGWLLGTLGRSEEGILEVRRAIELEPLVAAFSTDLATLFRWARQHDRAIEQNRKTLELDPNYFLAHMELGLAHAHKGEFVAAIAAIQKARQLSSGPLPLGALGYVYAVSGKRAEAQKLLEEAKELERTKRVLMLPWTWAFLHLGVGDRDRALGWLQKAYQERDTQMFLLKVDPTCDSLRADPRFQDLLRRMKLAN